MTQNKTKGYFKNLILIFFISIELFLYILTYYHVVSYTFEVVGTVAVILLTLGIYYPVNRNLNKKTKPQTPQKQTRNQSKTGKTKKHNTVF